jgi:hypothetical protein
MATVIPEEGRFADPDDIKSQIREYVKLKASEDMIKKRTAELREIIFAEIDQDGYEDDKGNHQLDLEEEVEGVFRLEKQRRTKRVLDETKAEEIVSELGLTEELYEMKPVLNEDALMAAFYEEKITEYQLEEMYPLNVTWALRTVKK